jgi:PilZ domain-containing protein
LKMALPARLEHGESETDRRNSNRRTLRLRVPGSTISDAGVAVLVHDISESGLLIETKVDLALGTVLDIDFPEVGPQAATVMWNRDQFYGCEFETPVSKAGLSAALLKSYAGQEARTESDQPEDDSAEPESGKLPMRHRFAIIVVLALACWAACVGLYMLIVS